MGNTLSDFATLAKQENNNMSNYNNNNIEKWAISAMCQKPCLLFPINLCNITWLNVIIVK